MKNNNKSTKDAGFTLLEIMIVSVIIASLALLVVPSYIQTRTTTRTNICINNLRIINEAKSMYAIENSKTDGDLVNDADLDPYIKVNIADLVEPSSGAYTVNPIGSPATCSIGGSHAL